MRQILSRRVMTMMVGVLLLPSLAVLAAGPQAAADDTDRAHPVELAVAEPVALTVEHTPAPQHLARTSGVRAYSVPTSGAALARITTAPNGDMWFVEREKNKVGRITLSGAITEFGLPTVDHPHDVSTVQDLDVDASGNVWVVFDTGSKVIRFHPSNPDGAIGWVFDPQYPYGEEIRVGPGATWLTMNYDEKGIARIANGANQWEWHSNAPECDRALGRGRDGLMWCEQWDRLIRVNAGGDGGVAFPLPDDANYLRNYPRSVATGPTGKIWFGRYSGPTWFTSADYGDVGWIDDDGRVRIIRTGTRTAPSSLVAGRDGNVWFTSIGAARGIGHVTPTGTGAIVKVGNYKPTSLTYGADGAIWFTDEANNAIVRVPRESLWVTNVDVGGYSQLKPYAQPPVSAKKRIKANKKRRKARLTARCGSGRVNCAGKVQIKARKKKLGAGSYRVAPSSSARVTIRLNKRARKLLRAHQSVKVKVVFRASTGTKTTRKGTLVR